MVADESGDDVPAENREDLLPSLESAAAALGIYVVPPETETHPLAMCARTIAEQLSKEVDFSHVKRLLDISAEDGALSHALCEHNLELAVTVLDPADEDDEGYSMLQDRTTEDSCVCIKRLDPSGRITFVSGSHHTVWNEAFKIEHDVVLMQRSSDAMSEVAIRALYGRAFQGLRPGGVVLMIDVVAEQVSGPNQPALPQASMVSEMLAAGFTEIQQMCLCNSMGQLLIGKKPFQAANHCKDFADNSVFQAR